MAEAFIGTFKRDYLGYADLRDAEAVLAQFGGWFDNYNTRVPYSALGMRPPAPHEALDQAAPAACYAPSPRPMPDRLPPLE